MPRPRKPAIDAAPWDADDPATFPALAADEIRAIDAIVRDWGSLSPEWLEKATIELASIRASANRNLPLSRRPARWTANQEGRLLARTQIAAAVLAYREHVALRGLKAPNEGAVAARLEEVSRAIREVTNITAQLDYWTREALSECGWGFTDWQMMCERLRHIDARVAELRSATKRKRPNGGKPRDEGKRLLMSSVVATFFECFGSKDEDDWMTFVRGILDTTGISYPDPAKRPNEFRSLVDPALLGATSSSVFLLAAKWNRTVDH